MAENEYAWIIDNMTWSYSRLKAFESCRYGWLLRYIFEDVEQPMFYSSYGKFIHELIEAYNKGEVGKDSLVTEFLTNFSSRVKGERPPESTVSKYISKGVDYFKAFNELPYNTVATEEFVEFVINGYNFVGFIDYLGEKDGDYYVVDHKSRDLKPRSKRSKPTKSDEELDEMLVQLYLYAEAVKQKYGKYPRKLIFNCFKEGRIIEEDFNEEACERAKLWAVNTIMAIKNADDFYPAVDFFHCKYLCGYHNECCYWNGG